MPKARPARAKAEEKPKPDEEKEALAEVDENTENAKVAPKRGRGRPPKNKTVSDTGGEAENVDHNEVGDEPAVKKAKKKPQTSKNVTKISIEFCKS